jgi:5'-methylthioadenosine phosphorylase
MSYAIIGGTGLAELASLLDETSKDQVETPYGQVEVVKGAKNARQVFFLARHGLAHELAPHVINYRANIWALKELGVSSILAGSAVGSLRTDIKPGDFILIDQFIDFTKGRRSTFFDGIERELKHIDVTEPYDAALRQALKQAAEEKGVRLHSAGTYVCTEGPRFETPAEIQMFAQYGADVVGMTGVPEVVLANELEIAYAALTVATNYAAGLAGHRLTYEECAEEMKKWDRTVFDIFVRAAETGDL